MSYRSQEEFVYKSIDEASYLLTGSRIDSSNLVYFLGRNGRDIHGIRVEVPKSIPLAQWQKNKVREFEKKVNDLFEDLMANSRTRQSA